MVDQIKPTPLPIDLLEKPKFTGQSLFRRKQAFLRRIQLRGKPQPFKTTLETSTPTPSTEKPTFNSPRTVPRSIRHYLLKKNKIDILKLMDES